MTTRFECGGVESSLERQLNHRLLLAETQRESAVYAWSLSGTETFINS